MIINGIDLSSLGVKLYDRVITSNTVDTVEEWLDGDIQPTHIRQQDRFKSVKLSFLVLGQDEDDAFLRISKLTAMLKKATVKFDDINLTFDLTLVGKANPERLKNGNFIVSYTLNSNYAKGEREIYTTDAKATNMFKLTVLYYQNATTLLSTDTVNIRANAFEDTGNTLASIGIDVNKYRMDYYNEGVPTNLNGMELTYDNLHDLQTLIINYAPTVYNLVVDYYMKADENYNQILSRRQQFTYPQLQKAQTIGQIIDAKTYKPEGYRATIDYDGALTVEALLLASPIAVLYDQIKNEQNKNIVVYYEAETDDGSYERTNSLLINVSESGVVDGATLADFINVDVYRPNPLYYNKGYIINHSATELVEYNTLETSYTVRYSRTVNTIYLEYYAGVYPDWYRLTAIPLQTKYKDSYETNFSINELGIDLNKYHTATYQDGALYNADSFTTYQSVITAGVLQIYYVPIDYPLVVRYYTQGSDAEPVEETIQINELMFFSNPTLNDIVGITKHRPEGYQFDEDNSYKGEITLSALTQNMPIIVAYKEIEAVRTKNIIIRYRQELASAFSTINTSLITVNEADCAGGVRLNEIIPLNAYRPDYYEAGVIDGTSSTALLSYDTLASDYNVLYMASTYTTPVRYYTDDVDERNWIGSNTISYRVIDFTAETTLYDLGFNLNAYKPTYCDNGILQYTGPVNFTALRELTSIDVLYETIVEPDDPSGIDYPHRFLFLQHNDLGAFEGQHPNWTMNHAYINTGVSADDMSKLTVVMECDRVDDNVPLHEVNEGYAYLFGSTSPAGSFYMRFNNQTMYGTNLTGVNTYEAKAGLYSNPLTLTEENAIGFSENTGIYASARDGYSIATFTYSNQLQSENAQMPYPLFLFANNNAGSYADGLGGIGIYGCRIYYNDELIRDFIPVQFYDKIGDQIAPSNCLYDKVSKAFFEDATGMYSFNIIDDDRFPITNPAHKIGQYYVKYYQNNVEFKTVSIPFRGDEFNTEWDWDERLHIADFQPPYHKPGEVINKDLFPVINFETVNNAIFQVNYEEIENQVQVYYYRDTIDDAHLIKQETITLTEKDFYQAPTFGDLIRLNKYRPDGYKTDFQYTGSKVSLNRIVENQPYRIVYVPETEAPQEYTTTIKYIRKIFGPHNYETLGSTSITLNDSQFRDGEYIDFFIDFNLMKPEKYYNDGEPYEWYLLDNRLDKPENLKNEYIVAYQPAPQTVEVNYYTDDIDEANLVASTDWIIQIDEFDGPFYLVDMLPNDYINKFKPVNCDGGILQNTNILYTFDELVQKGTIEIMYESIIEPDDPTNASYIQKVLYWNIDDSGIESAQIGNRYMSYTIHNGGTIPYIDLGYKPKEIGRLAVDTKMYLNTRSFTARVNSHSFSSKDYLYGFGYVGAITQDQSGQGVNKGLDSWENSIKATDGSPIYYKYRPEFSPCSSGGFAIRPRIPVATTSAYTNGWFSYLDGIKWTDTYTNLNGDKNVSLQTFQMPYDGMIAEYRKGKYEDTDINWEPFIAYNTYGQTKTVNNVAQTYPYSISAWDYPNLTDDGARMANPFTIKLDAYHSRVEMYNYSDSNTPIITTFDESKDVDTFDNRCKPKGSLTLFRTRNPDTGKMNIMAFNPYTYPSITGTQPPGVGPSAFQQMLNPYDSDYSGTIMVETLIIIDNTGSGRPIFEWQERPVNVDYSDVPVEIFPQLSSGYIWYMKIYDRDRLVRDLIPVAKGDKIYDYVMPDNGMFDLITEIFFGNSNQGGKYEMELFGRSTDNGKQLVKYTVKREIKPEQICPLHCKPDPMYWGKITENYYDYDNSFIANQYVDVPTWFHPDNDTIENVLQFNDYKPSDFHLDGMLDTDNPDNPWENYTLKDVYDAGEINIYYKLRTFAKTITYYQDNVRVGTKDIFFSLEDIDNATTLADLGIDVDLYWTPEFKHGRVVFNEKILSEDDVSAFIDAPSPIVVYDKLSVEEAPDLLYLEYYRGGAYDNTLITLDETNVNYLNCDLTGIVLNPNGAVKYYNHYHDALYEDEKVNYFRPYQVKVLNKYTAIHYGPGRKYKTLAQIVERDTYTIIDERNGWGRLKEYYHGWILLNQTEPMTGPGQNPAYDVPGETTATIPFTQSVHITKLTIDRLWCYVPEVESWVKAEDLSFDQAGRLYNGLKINVIHLDEVDWANVSTLADVGIYPEAYKLQYHNYTGYTYNGEYTKEAFSNLHSIDFVYPETVYTSSCIYYKHAKAPENELGRVSISYTLSDWNPDWDIFLETSWKTNENSEPIPPTLYRGVPLTLNWDFYGFDKNMYRPDGYPDGFYLWNPRGYNDENVSFTFEDLVIVGTQYVIYPEFHWENYKAKVVNGDFRVSSDYAKWVRFEMPKNDDNAYYDINDLSIMINSTGQEFLPIGYYSGNAIGWQGASIDKDNPHTYSMVDYPFVDIQFPDFIKTDNDTGITTRLYIDGQKQYIYGIINNKLNKDPIYYIKPATVKTNPYEGSTLVEDYELLVPAIDLTNTKYNKYETNKYLDNTQMTLHGTTYVQPYKYPTLGSYEDTHTVWWFNTKWYQKPLAVARIPDSNTTSLNSYPRYSTEIPTIEDMANANCYTSIKIYAKNMLKKFFVPIPEGTTYTLPDGTKAKAMSDSFINLLDLNEIVSLTLAWEYFDARWIESSTTVGSGYVQYTDYNDGGTISGGVYRVADDLRDINNLYNPFEGWSFDKRDISYIVKTTKASNSYKYPDIANASGKQSVPAGLIIPVNKLTTDTANGVEGEWYGFNSPTRWIQSANCSIYSEAIFDLSLLQQKKQTVCALSQNTSVPPEKVNRHLNPADTNEKTVKQRLSSPLLTVQYIYNNKYGFTGYGWYDLTKTSYDTTADNKNYVVASTANIPVYSQPFANDMYKTQTYMRGDRLTVLYRSTYNSHWCYTGAGWIYNVDDNLSLVE